jgi:hypothetical protein
VHTLEQTAQLSSRLIGLALALQTLELLAVRAALSDRGVWRYAELRAEYERASWPVRVLTRGLLPYRRFLGVLLVQLGAALTVLVLGATPLLMVLVATHLLSAMRFRGSYNGGSDAMTALVLVCLVPAALGASDGWLGKVALGYLAVQAVLSYFVAGVIKLKEPSWRAGTALSALLSLPKYQAPSALLRVLSHGTVARTGAWLVMLFEASFPLALLSTRCCLVYLALALLFHVANAVLLGLNRFIFAWLAAYPALLHLSQFGPLQHAS